MAYGDSVGFTVTDEEVARELLKYEVFQKMENLIKIYMLTF